MSKKVFIANCVLTSLLFAELLSSTNIYVIMIYLFGIGINVFSIYLFFKEREEKKNKCIYFGGKCEEKYPCLMSGCKKYKNIEEK